MVVHINNPSTIENKTGGKFKEVWAAHLCVCLSVCLLLETVLI